MRYHLSSASAALALAISLLSATAHAQTAGDKTAASAANMDEGAQLTDIVVTAQRRQESLQTVPIAASAVTSTVLQQRNVLDVRDVAQIVPNLRIDSPFHNTVPKLTLRGVGSGAYNQNSESTVALYLDDLVLNAPSAKLGQLYDLERVEVLRGPQGTLYGKNTTGGAINFISRRPSGDTSFNGSATVARFGEYDIDLGAETALTDALSIRVAARRRYRDGYVENTFADQKMNDFDDCAGRVGIRYKTDTTDIYLKFFGDRSRTNGTAPVTLGVDFSGAPIPSRTNPLTLYTRPNDIDVGEYQENFSNVDNRGIGLNIDQEVGDLTISSVTGYLFSKQALAQDSDGSPIELVGTTLGSKTRQFSQELRVATPKDRPFSFILGATYFNQLFTMNNRAFIPVLAQIYAQFGVTFPPTFAHRGRERTSSWAGFFDATYKLTDRLSVFGGLRMTSDKKRIHFYAVDGISIIGPFDERDSHRWTKPTYRAGINMQVSQETLIYASYNHGYRSGAYDTSYVASPLQVAGPVNPEYVDNYEGGIKTTVLNRRLRLNAAIFYTRFKDQQIPVVSDFGLCCALANAGKSRIMGIEAEMAWRVTPNFDVNLNVAVTDGKYLEFFSGIDYSGSSLGNLADYEVRLAPEYRIPTAGGNFFIAPEVLFIGTSRRSTTPDAFRQDVLRPYQLVNGQIGFRSDHGFSVFGFVKNATNKRYLTDFANSPGFGFSQNWYSEPRVYGLTGTLSF